MTLEQKLLITIMAVTAIVSFSFALKMVLEGLRGDAAKAKTEIRVSVWGEFCNRLYY